MSEAEPSPAMPDPSTVSPADRLREDRRFFGHPLGLLTLFTTELWERFSYYGMRALLPLYLVAPAGLGLDVPTATAITSLYMALVYLLALPGGWFGDRYWGPRKTVAIAAGIVMAGHLSLALPGTVMFYFGLLLVALGSLRPSSR